MISTDENKILYIEPLKNPFLENPSLRHVIDDLTRKMAAAFIIAKSGPSYRGVHTCICGVHSSNCDYYLPNNDVRRSGVPRSSNYGGYYLPNNDDIMINSLCMHYLAFHRSEVPPAELNKVRALTYGEREPSLGELKPPTPKGKSPFEDFLRSC